jgi:tRNA dimethylallyltransferase
MVGSTGKNKRVIVIAGPTAVGKTAAAIAAAKYFGTEIISADSRQCFHELNIGVARPGDEELRQVTHHFIASHSVHEEMNAALFEQYALQKAGEIFKVHDTAVVVGGTGLYIKAFCEGLDDIPPVAGAIRKGIVDKYEREGLEWLREEVKSKDPDFYKMGETMNPQRLMRALEVIESTGRSVLQFRKGKKVQRDFDIIKTGLELPKEDLHRNINNRADQMIEAGLIEEVRRLLPYRELNALRTVGYAEIFEYLDGKLSLDDAIGQIRINTRQYAKRQMTWFRKDKEIKWFSPLEPGQLLSFLNRTLEARQDPSKTLDQER